MLPPRFWDEAIVAGQTGKLEVVLRQCPLWVISGHDNHAAYASHSQCEFESALGAPPRSAKLVNKTMPCGDFWKRPHGGRHSGAWGCGPDVTEAMPTF